MTIAKEPYETPAFKPGQRVIVTANPYRNHLRIDHLMGRKVTITGRAWDRGAHWYTIKTDDGDTITALRFSDFRPLRSSDES